jgi:thioredoxin-dependent peroxiredoxin
MRTTLLLLGLALFTACGSSTARTESATTEGSGEGAPAAGPVAVGSPAPDFMLQDQTGRVRTLGEYRGHPVVLYFYPRDATPGCTAEACAFRDAWDRLQASGAVVLGVSTDDVVSHQRFHDEHHLPFDLLADTDQAAANAYGVPVRMGGFASRQTFLIDAQGNIARVWPDVDPGVHADEVIAAIAALPAPAP